MSVGHLARIVEESGIPTVVIATAVFEEKMRAMNLPRLLLTNQMMGRTLGMPGDVETQLGYIHQALDLLESTRSGGQVINAG